VYQSYTFHIADIMCSTFPVVPSLHASYSDAAIEMCTLHVRIIEKTTMTVLD
jgi:hypothetical protein